VAPIRILLTILMLIVSYNAYSQRDTVIFTGVNGKLVSENQADRKKEVDFQSRGRIQITTFNLVDGNWQRQYRERIKTLKNDEFKIRAKGTSLSEQFVRRYEKRPDGKYNFSEYSSYGVLLKTGVSKSRFPLIFDGELIEYYGNQQMRSRSQYRNNELLSNENWRENGEKYIDNIFYSVDAEPLYSKGMIDMHNHVKRSFIESGLEVATLSGNLLIGFVVMESGQIEGIRVLKGITPSLNAVAVNSLNSLEGKWTPAKLNGKDVRYFQLFPINFIHRENRFESVEFNGSMLHWDIN
jgi:periplasmic protein TonB